MTEQKTCKILRYLLASSLIIFLQGRLLFAQNVMYVNKVSDNVATVELYNSDLVAAFQFTLHASSGISLKDFQKEERLSEVAWVVTAHLKNDTTLNVIVINAYLNELFPGRGKIILINFTKNISTTNIQFRLSNIILSDKNGKSVPVDTQEVQNIRDNDNHNLLQNFPNPFNPTTTISYRLETASHVQLTIYDITGKLVRKLCDEIRSSGNHAVVWNSTNDQNQHVASGTYLYRLNVGGKVTTKKLTLAR